MSSSLVYRARCRPARAMRPYNEKTTTKTPHIKVLGRILRKKGKEKEFGQENKGGAQTVSKPDKTSYKPIYRIQWSLNSKSNTESNSRCITINCTKLKLKIPAKEQ